MNTKMVCLPYGFIVSDPLPGVRRRWQEAGGRRKVACLPTGQGHESLLRLWFGDLPLEVGRDIGCGE